MKQYSFSTRTNTKASKVVNLAYYRIRRSLRVEGFDLVTDRNGDLRMVMRINNKGGRS